MYKTIQYNNEASGAWWRITGIDANNSDHMSIATFHVTSNTGEDGTYITVGSSDGVDCIIGTDGNIKDMMPERGGLHEKLAYYLTEEMV